jgi:DNA ligase D-like protein (predicted 3'-phosphoesterase)
VPKKESLKRYREKRDFKRTPEPGAGGPAKGKSKQKAKSKAKRARRPKRAHPRYAVQKHDARSLHYDLRLEVDDSLASWAVPKGPSTDPAEKRLAMRTEDHPLEYLEFEGVIPEGEYGAGPMIVWDRGVFANVTEKKGRSIPLADGIEHGHIHIVLAGEKLRGGYALNRVSKEGERERWILVKTKDDDADPEQDPVSDEPRSVISGKTIEELADES